MDEKDTKCAVTHDKKGSTWGGARPQKRHFQVRDNRLKPTRLIDQREGSLTKKVTEKR